MPPARSSTRASATAPSRALEYDPKEPVGLDGALQRLSEQPYGPALLGTVAAGLVAFGVFSLARARYREV